MEGDPRARRSLPPALQGPGSRRKVPLNGVLANMVPHAWVGMLSWGLDPTAEQGLSRPWKNPRETDRRACPPARTPWCVLENSTGHGYSPLPSQG